jgi:hypothetical protein
MKYALTSALLARVDLFRGHFICSSFRAEVCNDETESA